MKMKFKARPLALADPRCFCLGEDRKPAPSFDLSIPKTMVEFGDVWQGVLYSRGNLEWLKRAFEREFPDKKVMMFDISGNLGLLSNRYLVDILPSTEPDTLLIVHGYHSDALTNLHEVIDHLNRGVDREITRKLRKLNSVLVFAFTEEEVHQFKIIGGQGHMACDRSDDILFREVELTEGKK
jgi:hypothetical protein